MAILYLNSGSQDVLNKATYLLLAAQHLGCNNVQLINEPGDKEFVLNIQPYFHRFIQGSRWTGVWEIDCLINRERMKQWWDKADTIFLANRVEWLAPSDKYYYLYQACEPSFYKEYPEPEYDFVLAGSLTDPYYYKDFGYDSLCDKADIYTERQRLINLLQAQYSYTYLGKRLPIKEYLAASAKGKVQFIRSMMVLGEGEIAQRFFECLPIGPVLTNYTPDLDYLNLEEGKDYLSYRTDEELLEKMERLINDKPYRQRIADSGRQQAFYNHTYDNRLCELLDFLEERYGF